MHIKPNFIPFKKFMYVIPPESEVKSHVRTKSILQLYYTVWTSASYLLFDQFSCRCFLTVNTMQYTSDSMGVVFYI